MAVSEWIRKAMDQSITNAIYGASSVAAAPQEPFTLAKLQKMMASMPPKETWLSSKLFPADKAICVEGAGENFKAAHPDFWTRLRYELARSPKVERSPVGNPFGMSLDAIEIDAWPEDDEETAKWRRSHWDRFAEALAVAMQPIPDWLRAKVSTPPSPDKRS